VRTRLLGYADIAMPAVFFAPPNDCAYIPQIRTSIISDQRLGGSHMKRNQVVIGSLLLLVSMQVIAQRRQTCTGPQLGTWKLESYTTEDLATGQKSTLLGAHPSGFLHYGTDCRMYAILVKDGRVPPATFAPNDAERIELFGSFLAYAGTYRIEGDKVSHIVDASWNQSWTGTTQVRRFRIDGNHLYITTLPTKNALTGKESSSVLIWIKVE
jgi:hypothetical protein